MRSKDKDHEDAGISGDRRTSWDRARQERRLLARVRRLPADRRCPVCERTKTDPASWTVTAAHGAMCRACFQVARHQHEEVYSFVVEKLPNRQARVLYASTKAARQRGPKKRISARTLAEDAGISYSYLRQIEEGKPVPFFRLERIAQELGVAIEVETRDGREETFGD